ncbi:hypothetical protein [Streptomyces triticiradicis]|uniref:Uncharacterized protein n=1 Tax=Streptomyces triticiradicis TaxID=2651189 RepID=A0A7J5DG29_9ACTN|nr:hypothetical protein [Streptomyces triticiradicis]KAB1986831.1 hypothetical protein F8144_21205 [Streptomyces triticiradicis]
MSTGEPAAGGPAPHGSAPHGSAPHGSAPHDPAPHDPAPAPGAEDGRPRYEPPPSAGKLLIWVLLFVSAALAVVLGGVYFT